MNRAQITSVPCRVCEAEPGEPCHRQGSRTPIPGWHGARVADFSGASDFLPPQTTSTSNDPDWLPPLERDRA